MSELGRLDNPVGQEGDSIPLKTDGDSRKSEGNNAACHNESAPHSPKTDGSDRRSEGPNLTAADADEAGKEGKGKVEWHLPALHGRIMKGPPPFSYQ